jgi:2-iminobutanoate/2-iminopropanoate deaminase
MTTTAPFTAISRGDSAPPTGAYSPALRWGDLVFVSGQGPIGPDGVVMSGTIEDETRLTLENINALLLAAGSDLDHVVKCSCYLANIRDFARFDRAYRTAFGGQLPTRTTVQAGLDGIKIEIDAIAVVKERGI